MQCSKSCIPKTCWSLAAGLLTAFKLESGSWGSPRKQRNKIHRNRKTMTRQFKTKPSHLPDHLPAQSSHRHFSFTLCGPAQRQLQRQAKKTTRPCLSACQGQRLTRSLALSSSRPKTPEASLSSGTNTALLEQARLCAWSPDFPNCGQNKASTCCAQLRQAAETAYSS